MVGGKADEAGADCFPNQVLCLRILSLNRGLDLKLAASEAQVHDHIAAASRGPRPPQERGGAHTSLVLLDLVPSRDSQVDPTLANKGRDVGGGEEDEGNGQVLDQRNVESVLASELDVGPLEEVQRGLIEPPLWTRKWSACIVFLFGFPGGRGRGGGTGRSGTPSSLTLGDGEEQTAFEAGWGHGQLQLRETFEETRSSKKGGRRLTGLRDPLSHLLRDRGGKCLRGLCVTTTTLDDGVPK